MTSARNIWHAFPAATRAALLMVVGCILFSITGALVKLLGRRLDSCQIAFFRCFFGFLVTLPFVLPKRGGTTLLGPRIFMAIFYAPC